MSGLVWNFLKNLCVFVSLWQIYFFVQFCNNSFPMVELQGQALGAKFNIKYYNTTKHLRQNDTANYIRDFFIDLQNKTSLYQESSELISINSEDYAGWIRVSDPLGIMITYAQELSHMTGGYYDITTGALTNLWNVEGIQKVQPVLPSLLEIREARKLVNFQNLEIKHNKNGYFIYKKNVHTAIDLASITAGYAADVIAEYLESKNIQNYLIDIGGEFRSSGKNNMKDWWIGIENPQKTGQRIGRKISLKNMSMATSGNYRNYLKNNGAKYSHIIDPHEGKPVDGNLVSVSVIQEKCMKADALATAIMAMGEKRGFDFARLNHIPVLMMVLNKQGKLDFKISPDMERYLIK